jgi:hypothetical protein
MATVGTCALCLQSRDLRKSHFLPRALYKRPRSPGLPNPYPLLISIADERQTARQAWQHLLCSECEQRFHERGEDWVLRHCARNARTFKLREALLSSRGDRQPESDDLFLADRIPDVNADALCYFALSVIWRAAVRSWRLEGATAEALSLGHYQEQLRRYLLGESPHPDDVVVVLIVSPFAEVPLNLTFPRSMRSATHSVHFFAIPGLDFSVYMGKGVPRIGREVSLCQGPGRPLFYSPRADLQTVAALNRIREIRKSRGG